VIRLRDKMRLGSKLRYLTWRGLSFPDELTIYLRSGERFMLRKDPAADLQIAREIFALGAYDSPLPLESFRIRSIVDLGANVGYSVVHFAHLYPNARILAFEPHPTHARLIQKNARLNGLDGRLEILPVAVGVAESETLLSDDGVTSHLGAAVGIPVVVVDFFETVRTRGKIDLLKIDIEGAEYEIFMDRRFADIDVDLIVFEWHATGTHPEARHDIFARLRGLGWQVTPGATVDVPHLAHKFGGRFSVGVAWAYHPEESGQVAPPVEKSTSRR
jgi:FkbM family methyltransferase